MDPLGEALPTVRDLLQGLPPMARRDFRHPRLRQLPGSGAQINWLEYLGRGIQGIVYKATLGDDDPVAVKIRDPKGPQTFEGAVSNFYAFYAFSDAPRRSQYGPAGQDAKPPPPFPALPGCYGWMRVKRGSFLKLKPPVWECGEANEDVDWHCAAGSCRFGEVANNLSSNSTRHVTSPGGALASARSSPSNTASFLTAVVAGNGDSSSTQTHARRLLGAENDSITKRATVRCTNFETIKKDKLKFAPGCQHTTGGGPGAP
ncbi:hypothetical protein GGTG_12989 [Gaeumannomyces tritici R3-111a-1]|uniref:Protein kinase domain-containing protein n=1 Tax=Gaeumannomyces tritici (strain R3-111a-1) TaxID=644352 RepID=J3PHK9_GAET3|nr:hypothetical protein GGTG_12989 [Gaeumannomyces tritici R3-111a-1]EJT69370.1 hypothetical protein GGTG_12989 [Gaeumannomyces tritici R3-111a-1]